MMSSPVLGALHPDFPEGLAEEEKREIPVGVDAFIVLPVPRRRPLLLPWVPHHVA